jgi:hypothetical protein
LTDKSNNNFKKIEWKVHCISSTEKIFHLLSSNEGRKSFWAESTEEINGQIHFSFPNGQTYIGKILQSIPCTEFSLIYFDTTVTFQLSTTKNHGTDVTLINENVPANDYDEIKSGWISVLLALKAFADFGIDLRNHSKEKNWDTGFVDN